MHVRVLGAAAGGGFPQWNCSCRNCRRLRQGTFAGVARSQTQLAISSNPEHWFLVNASPDLRYQIESFPPLNARSISIRQSPVDGVILTSAELDASLGLLLLRESQPLVVYATAAVRELLTEDNNFFRVLERQPDQVRWRTIRPDEPFELAYVDGAPARIRCTPISTGGAFPGHVIAQRTQELNPAEAVIGLLLEHGSNRIAFFPGVQRVAPEWFQQFASCIAILFDGTFWCDDELIAIQGFGKTARQMGHLPVGDRCGTLEQFASLAGPRKIFIHINNTNPMLDEESDEYARVRTYGWEVAYDGMDLYV
jgi:pyrroloquinoline quinone biosynthesis protein B